MSSGTVMGTIYWTVRWVPAYPGEPVPSNALVTFKASGGGGLDAATSGLPTDTMLATASVGDAFYNNSISVAATNSIFLPFTVTTQTVFGGTGTFFLVAPNVYESTIQYTVNCGAYANATAPPTAAAVSGVKYNINLVIDKIGTQQM